MKRITVNQLRIERKAEKQEEKEHEHEQKQKKEEQERGKDRATQSRNTRQQQTIHCHQHDPHHATFPPSLGQFELLLDAGKARQTSGLLIILRLRADGGDEAAVHFLPVSVWAVSHSSSFSNRNSRKATWRGNKRRRRRRRRSV